MNIFGMKKRMIPITLSPINPSTETYIREQKLSNNSRQITLSLVWISATLCFYCGLIVKQGVRLLKETYT